MKKLAGVVVTIMLGIFATGCDSSLEQQEISIKDTNFELEQNEAGTEESKEEVTKEEQQETTNDEKVADENKILTMETDEEYKRIMTNILTDEEYKKYFDEKYEREIQIEGSIAAINLRDGFDTRVEMLLVSGDSTDSFTGPYIKVKDIAIISLNGLINVGDKFTATAKVSGYNLDNGYLEVSIEEINPR